MSQRSHDATEEDLTELLADALRTIAIVEELVELRAFKDTHEKKETTNV